MKLRVLTATKRTGPNGEFVKAPRRFAAGWTALAILPVVCEADENNDSNQMLKGMLGLGEICMKHLPRYFPELEPLAEILEEVRNRRNET